ncbi:MAG TPA: alkaline phosphatase family protein [Candidatus Sulfotelmatobacter sp.]|nr:alkaline phosphatase family protein [Candidatus Sulfotelmatobacter sp.]
MNRSQFISIAGKLVIVLALFTGVAAFSQVPLSNHVYIVAEENRSYEHIVGSTNMPYLNSLLAKGTTATQFYANMHGSLENYLIVTSGQYLTHNNETLAVFDVDNIERHLLTHGKTFKSYAQSLPFAGFTGLTSGAYLKRHAPLPYYTDMANSSLIMNHVSTTQMAKDIANGTLPNFAFITPDSLHDMHDCPSGLNVCLQTADAWLKSNIAPLLATAPFQPGGDGVLIIWADEADLSTDNRCSSSVSTGCGGRILVAMIGPRVKAGFKSTTLYHQESVLKTMLMLLGERTSFPAKAQTAPAMSDFFVTSAGSVQILAPTASSVTGPSVHLAATASGPNPITTMRIYVDNISQFSASESSIDTNLTMLPGTHNLTYQAWDTKGNVYKSTKSITVTGASTVGSITVLAPTSSTVTGSPVHLAASARAPNPITFMRIYVDSVSRASVSASSISANVTMSTGSHNVSFKAWDSKGNVYKTTRTITVK